MVKANELRIGNWIWLGGSTLETYQTSKPYQVTAEGIVEIKEENDERPDAILSVFQPIKLTPEILEQCGFVKDNEFDDTFRLGNFDIYYRKGYCEWTVDDRGDNEGTKPRLIKYLHQLQNLFAILTGEELVYQPIKELT